MEIEPRQPQQRSTKDLVGDFIDLARLNGAFVPRRVIGHLAKNVKDLLDEGATPDQVAQGLERLLERRIVQPSLLPNLVMEASLSKRPAMRMGRGLTAAEIMRQAREAQ